MSVLIRMCVFNIQWSPIVPQLLLSGSDDTTARVWDIRSGKCTVELNGHTSKIRGLMWHRALEFVVITGLDTRKACCMRRTSASVRKPNHGFCTFQS